MKSTLILLAALSITGGLLHLTVAQEPNASTGFVNLAPDDLVFEPDPGIPGASHVTLLGDPAQEGPYVIRYRIPAGVLVPPHYHDQDRHITVMAGTWAFGTGDSYTCEDTLPMPPGSYVFHPKGAVHFDGSCTDDPIEVQIVGMGPVKTVWLSEE